MYQPISKINLILFLIFAYVLTWITFSNEKVFWYFYTFTVLFLMSISLFYAKVKDEMKTIVYLIFGIGYGILTYVLLAIGYKLIEIIPFINTDSIDLFVGKFGPTSIWHFLLLLFIIAVGEEIFWRGFIQQQLKQWFSPFYSIVISAALFGLSLLFSGFWLGVLAAFLAGLIWGFLYEWKKSMPLIILAHITMLILLFLILPLN